MGALARSALEAGGKVIGVDPQFFIDRAVQLNGLTELIITPDMAQRKAKMIELGDAFIAFPGGTGTLEEVSEVMSKLSLGHLSAPCIFYNQNGYYDDVQRLLTRMISAGFSFPEKQKDVHFVRSLEAIRHILE